MEYINYLREMTYGRSEFWSSYSSKPKIVTNKKLVAYYLPQFHPIPENDHNWGVGFTEWRNVTRSMPIYFGHYQPRIPADLGYYDLTAPGIIKKQAEISKNYGLHGWALYYYWFDSKKLLHKPLDIIYNDKSIDINYCLFWANENWTSNWDGLNQNVLVKQNHNDEDDIRFIAEISKYFDDSRYIKFNGKPVLIVYRPSLFPNINMTIERWKNWCAINNVPVPYLINSQVFNDHRNPSYYGFDSSAEFPPHHSSTFDINNLRRITGGLSIYDHQRSFISYTYDSFVQASTHSHFSNTDFKLFKCVFPGWDNSARRFSSTATILQGSTPFKYSEWLKFCLDMCEDEDIIFINAWNEWAEGAYLEPDLRNGFAFLDATWSVLNDYVNSNN